MDPETDRRSITPDLVERLAAYYRQNPVWGSLHLVFEDGNDRRRDMEFCRDHAREVGDSEGLALAEELLEHYTRSQWMRAARRAMDGHSA